MPLSSGQTSRAPSWALDGRLYCVFLLALPFLIFWKNFVPGLLVGTSDTNIVTITALHENLRAGWEARWLNLWWLGMAGAIPTFNLENILVFLLPPVLYAKISIPLYLAMNGLAAYALGRVCGFTPPCSLVLGLGWQLMGSSFTDILGGHHSRQLMFAFVPVMYAGLWLAVFRKKWSGVVLAAAAVAVMVAHAVDVAMLQAMAGVAFFVWFKRREIAGWRFWAQAALGTVLTVALASQIFFVMIPQLTTGLKADQAVLNTPPDRAQSWQWHTQWSFAPEETLELFAPGFFGWSHDDPDRPYWGRVGGDVDWVKTRQGMRNFRIENPTLGAGVMGLAILGIAACWLRRPGGGADPGLFQAARFFTIVAGVSLLLSFGRHLPGYELLFDLGRPFFEKWRNPNKIFYVTSFCLVFLAAYGARAAILATTVEKNGADWLRAMAKLLLGVAAALLCLGLGVMVYANDLKLDLADRHWSPAESGAITSGMIRAAVAGSLIWAALGGILLLACRWREKKRASLHWLAAGWLIITAAQMWLIELRYVTFYNYQQALAPNPILQRVIEDQRREISRMKLLVTDAMLNGFYFLQLPVQNIQCIDIPQASRVPEDYALLFREMADRPDLLWSMCNVRHVLGGRHAVEQFQSAFPQAFSWVADYAIQPYNQGALVSECPRDAPEAAYRVVKLNRYLARAQLVPDMRKVPDARTLFETVKQGKADLEKTVLVLETAPVSAPPAGQLPATRLEARIREFSDNRVVIDVSCDRPSYLVFNTKFDPGWSATVGGKSAPIFRANFILQGVEVPAGDSEVVFTWGMSRKPLIAAMSAWAALIVGFGFIFAYQRLQPHSGRS